MFVICYNFSKRNVITTHGRENLNFENDDTRRIKTVSSFGVCGAKRNLIKLTLMVRSIFSSIATNLGIETSTVNQFMEMKVLLRLSIREIGED